RRALTAAAMMACTVAVVAVALDPRTGGWSPLEGGYERVVADKLAEPARLRIVEHLGLFVADSLPRALVGVGDAPVLGTLLSVAAIAAIVAARVTAWM